MLKQRVAANLISNYALTFVSMLLGFILVPFLIRKVGQEAYGIIVLAESTILIFEVLTISVRMALSRHAAFAMAQGKQADFIQYLATGRCLTVVSAAVVLAASAGLSVFFPVIFRVPAELAADSRWLFFYISAAFAVTILTSIYWSVLYAYQRFDLINIASSGGLIVRAASILVLFSVMPAEHRTLSVYGLMYLAMIIADNALVRIWQRKLMPQLRIHFRDYRKEKLRDILSFSAYSSLSRMSAVLYDSTSNILINRFWGPGANALYSVGLKFPAMMEKLFLNAAWSLTPVLTDLVARGEREQFKRLYYLYTKFITVLTTPLALTLMFMAGPLIRFWVGPEFEESARILPILMAPLLIAIPYSVSGCITNAYGKVKLPSQINFISSIANVLLGIALGKWLGLGILGIACATAITSLAYVSLFLTGYACRISGLPFFEYSRNAFIKPFLASAAVVGAAYGAARWLAFDLSIRPLSVLFAAAVILLDFYVSYRWVLDTEERRQVRNVLRALFAKIGLSFAEDTQTA